MARANSSNAKLEAHQKKHKDIYSIVLDSTVIDLRYDFNALAYLEDAMGKSIEVLLQDFTALPKAKFLIHAIRAGVLHNHKTSAAWPPEKIGRHINGVDFAGVMKNVVEAIARTVAPNINFEEPQAADLGNGDLDEEENASLKKTQIGAA
jgi:hypothetical protein